MELTKEQAAIIGTSGDIRINAVAGSGKTTTIIEYARSRPSKSRILYLAFNRSVKLEAAKKFADLKLTNVKAETAHSLAYRNIVFRHGYAVRAQGYRTHEIAELLHLKGNGEKHVEHILANHIGKLVTLFCNSDKDKLRELDYAATVSDPKAKAFVKASIHYIQEKARLMLAKMDKGEIEITHDFYLKKFQLSNPQLNYDYILFDEGQDASPVMLDVFMKQQATRVIVGDTHQQIYSWRHAVNSLERAAFASYSLSTSFRFGQHIADLGVEILKFKKHIGKESDVVITGQGGGKEINSKAIIARTNLGLLLKAIEYVTEKNNLKNLYFEGNIHSYTYADEGASLYDVLNLYNGKKHQIKDSLIRSMKDLKELDEYIEKTEDVQLGMMVEIVREYGNEIPSIIRKIKALHVENDEKEKAQMIFSTVHRCKGMEYDSVQLVNDFITEKKLEKFRDGKKADELTLSRQNEEINLLYVAVTRARNSVHIPESLMPKDFPAASSIHVVKDLRAEETPKTNGMSWKEMDKLHAKNRYKNFIQEKMYNVEEVREKHHEAYQRWTDDLDDELALMFREGVNLRDLAKHFGRTKGAIQARLKRLHLEDEFL